MMRPASSTILRPALIALVFASLGCMATAAPAKPAATDRFGALRDRWLDQFQSDDPAFGRSLGLHQYDGLLADYSAAGIKARLARLHAGLDELAAIDVKALSPDQALDYVLIRSQVEQGLFFGEDLDLWEKSPMFYGDLFGVNVYLDRDYGPVADRAAKLLMHEKAALAVLPLMRANLKGPFSKPVTETAINVYAGYAEYLRGEVVSLLKGVGSPEFQADFAKTNEALAVEAEKIATWLKKDELPRGDSSHILGLANFQKLLRVQEGLTTPVAELRKMGEDNLAANQKIFDQLKEGVHVTRSTADSVLTDATRMMNDARDFVIAKKIATLRTEDRAVVKETPAYDRWNAASLDPPGPYEPHATTAFYYITKPNPTWPKEEQEGYLEPKGVLMSTTVHEVYPGHFLQFQWSKNAPTRAQRNLGSYSFIEGWAHYVEQMMADEGFGADDPQNRFGQVTEALLRDCRFLASIGMHTDGMTLEQAETLFMNQCHQDKATAHEQAVRGTFDPGYFAYTLGKIQILALRDEARARLGDKFSLQKFHDALLSHGSPAVPLIRARVLADLGVPTR